MTNSKVQNLAERFAALHGQLEPLVEQYDEDMNRLERDSRNATGQAKKKLKQEIETRRERCLQDLLDIDPAGAEVLVSVFADKATGWFSEEWPRREDARFFYMRIAAEVSSKNGGLALPQTLNLDPWPPKLFHNNWLAIEVSFTLQTPWYSKDDRPFHVLDNPVRKDRVFGVPYMPPASWKGLLRWSSRMLAGLREHLEKTGGRLDGWRDPKWILHFFGNEKGASEDFQHGALAFYPTWFSRIGFEVINPHSRKTRAGTQPIYYEVVPPGVKGTLRVLYAPLPSQADRRGVEPKNALDRLLDAIEKLVTVYGFSAKRTAGWGLAKVDKWVVCNTKGRQEGDLATVQARLSELLGTTEATP